MFLIHDYGRLVKISSYKISQSTKYRPTISGAVACDHPQSGQIYILVYNKSVYYDNISNHLVSSIHSYMNGVNINENSKFLS